MNQLQAFKIIHESMSSKAILDLKSETVENVLMRKPIQFSTYLYN